MAILPLKSKSVGFSWGKGQWGGRRLGGFIVTEL